MKIEIRAIITEDVKIIQSALESIGFKTVKEGDNSDAYWIEMDVPEKYQKMTEEEILELGFPKLFEQTEIKIR